MVCSFAKNGSFSKNTRPYPVSAIILVSGFFVPFPISYNFNEAGKGFPNKYTLKDECYHCLTSDVIVMVSDKMTSH